LDATDRAPTVDGCTLPSWGESLLAVTETIVLTSQRVVGNRAQTLIWPVATECNGRLPAGSYQRSSGRLRAGNGRLPARGYQRSGRWLRAENTRWLRAETTRIV